MSYSTERTRSTALPSPPAAATLGSFTRDVGMRCCSKLPNELLLLYVQQWYVLGVAVARPYTGHRIIYSGTDSGLADPIRSIKLWYSSTEPLH